MANYNRKDHLYQKAKDEGYRSRAAYKLIELDEKYELLEPGDRVLDLGAWPGGWLQVAAKSVGSRGVVVGLDLVAVEPLAEEQVYTLCGDACDEILIQEALRLAGGRFDSVLSDMSPKLTGIREADDMGIAGCAEIALWAAQMVLKPDGVFAAKLFKGNETEAFVKKARPLFNKLIRTELKATRGTSSEYYCIGFGFKGGRP